MRKNAILILFTFFFLLSFGEVRVTGKEKINWLSIEEVQLKAKEIDKPLLIDLYTNWCYWCKVMDKRTYKNAKVVAYINEHFYAVKINAETKNEIIWNNKNYVYLEDNKLNEFALFLSNGQLSFPTTVIFSEIGGRPAFVPGFLEPENIEPILKYFGEGNYKKQDFQSYLTTFKSTW